MLASDSDMQISFRASDIVICPSTHLVFPSASALMQFPRARRLRLMWAPSFRRLPRFYRIKSILYNEERTSWIHCLKIIENKIISSCMATEKEKKELVARCTHEWPFCMSPQDFLDSKVSRIEIRSSACTPSFTDICPSTSNDIGYLSILLNKCQEVT